MKAEMEVVNGKLVYGQAKCYSCIDGKHWGVKECPKCHGTRRTKGGKGRGQCTACLMGKVPDIGTRENMVVCGRCKGTGFEPSTRYDSVPEAIMQQLPIRVDRSPHPYTWNEAYLGMGHLSSVTDYGECHKLTDEQLVAKVKAGSFHTQALNVTTKDDVLCKGLVINVNRQGYTIDAEF